MLPLRGALGRRWDGQKFAQSDVTVTDPVEGRLHLTICVESVVPFREVQVTCDDSRPSLVPIRDDVAKVLVLPGAHGLETEVADDEQVRLGQCRQLAFVIAHGLGGGELAQQLSVGGEHGVVAATYGDVTQCLGKVALPGAAGADDEHRDLLLQVATGGQIHDLRLVHPEVEGEVVAFERLLRVDTSPALPHDEFALLTASDLVFDEQGQEVGVGELLLHGLTVADFQ